MNLRRMTEAGIGRFADFLEQLRSDLSIETPKWLLEDEESTEEIANLEVSEREFPDRLAAAIYLDQLFMKAQLKNIDKDVGLWTWLTLLYFDQLCPKAKNRSVAVTLSYIPNIDSQRRIYRHLLLGPWMMLRLHADNPERLRALLCSKMNVATSETYRLFVEIPSIVTSSAAVEAAYLLYYNSDTGKLKRGAGSKERGGCRRLIDFLNQIDCTYDLHQLNSDTLMSMIPNEFRPFVPKQQEFRFGE